MLNNNSITEFPRQDKQAESITLDYVIQEINDWRANKRNRSEAIPDNIWKNIFILLNKFPETTICIALGITKPQLHHKLNERKASATIASQFSELPHIDFCEVKQASAPKVSPIYKPAKIPATNTLVVEFCRADGKIMKIHTTTDSFAELMKAFFSGE